MAFFNSRERDKKPDKNPVHVKTEYILQTCAFLRHLETGQAPYLPFAALLCSFTVSQSITRFVCLYGDEWIQYQDSGSGLTTARPEQLDLAAMPHFTLSDRGWNNSRELVEKESRKFPAKVLLALSPESRMCF